MYMGQNNPRSDMLRWIDDSTPLPSTAGTLGQDSMAPGLVAAGGRVTPVRLQEAYSRGIFPWYSSGQPVLWWSPDPRMVLPVAQFKLARSLRKAVRRFISTPGCEIRFDHDFESVARHCAQVQRRDQDGTWIVPAMIDAYAAWHQMGQVHSVETWTDGELVGGLYFVCIGRMCFGESMFSRRTDASKIALAALVAACKQRDIPLIDCQQQTDHLASLGAHAISRADFEQHLASHVRSARVAEWSYDPAAWQLL